MAHGQPKSWPHGSIVAMIVSVGSYLKRPGQNKCLPLVGIENRARFNKTVQPQQDSQHNAPRERSTRIVTREPISRPDVLEILRELIRTPSVNPSLVPEEAHGEQAIATVAQKWLAAKGVKSWMEDAGAGRPNAVGEVGRGEGPSMIFCAHLDTVGTAGMTIPPFDPKLEGDRVYGRGSYDMKGSAAAIMAAAVALGHEDFPGKVLVALVADEEYASIGAQDFVKRHKADACLLTEPSEGKLILAHKGFVWAEIVAKGRAAHGSRWDLGNCAIAKMAKVIMALEDFDQRELRNRTHPLVGPASQHCSLIRGGSGLSTYPEECTLQIERRTLPGETPEQVLEELNRVIRSTGEQADVRLLLERAPLSCDADAKIVDCLRQAITTVTGRQPEEAGVAYWMDAALFAAAGIPTVNYGPSGAGAHAAVEWVDINSVVTCAQVLVKTAWAFCGR